MTRFAAIPLALALIVLSVGRTDAQDQRAITPKTTPKTTEVIPAAAAQREPVPSPESAAVRQLAEAFVAAVLAGRTADAAALTTSKRAASKEWMEEFREEVGVESLGIESVHVQEMAGFGLAVSPPIKLAKPHPDVGDNVRVVLQLVVDGGGWKVRDADFWSDVAARKAVERYEHEYSAPTPKYLAGKDVVVSWSEQGDAVWGFSKSIGRWTKQEIRPVAEEGLIPLVDSSVAALQVGRAIYAYSPQTGRWDVLRLPGDRKPRMSVDADIVLVTDGPSVHTFANSTGQWSSPDAAGSSPAEGRDAMLEEELANVQQQLAARREDYNQLEQQAARLAQQYRDLPLKATRTPGDAEALKRQLTDVVNEAFEARQKLQRAELDALRQRLAGAERQIAARDRIKDQIIDRRVEDLLNQDRKWDPRSSGTTTTSTDAAQATATREGLSR